MRFSTDTKRSLIVLAAFVVLMIWVKHSQNIVRLLQGTEKSWKKK